MRRHKTLRRRLGLDALEAGRPLMILAAAAMAYAGWALWNLEMAL
jgi:hypothetical protein